MLAKILEEKEEDNEATRFNVVGVKGSYVGKVA
jgi:hypothetical protein